MCKNIACIINENDDKDKTNKKKKQINDYEEDTFINEFLNSRFPIYTARSAGTSETSSGPDTGAGGVGGTVVQFYY